MEETNEAPKRCLKLDVILEASPKGYMFAINFKDDEKAGSIRMLPASSILDASVLLSETLRDFMKLKHNEFEHWLNPLQGDNPHEIV